MQNRIKRALAFVLTIGLLPSLAQKPLHLPKDLPAYGPLKPFVPPPVIASKLPNGMTVWLVPRPGYPKVAFALAVRGGLANDPENFSGLSELLSSTLMLGTKSRTAKQIAQEIAASGGDISAHAGKDSIVVATDVPSWKMRNGLEILADVAQHAAFPDAEVSLAKRNAADELRGQESRPGFLAYRAVEKVVFGTNPYSVYAPTEASIAKMDSAVLRQTYERRFQPGRSILIAVGDFDASQIFPAIESAFGNWPASQAQALQAVVKPRRNASRYIFVVDRPGSIQTTIAIGSIGPMQRDPDYPAFQVANTLYGGMFSARLDSDIREDKGYTYGAGSEYQTWAQTALLLSAANVRNAVTGAALNEFEYQLNRMATTSPDPEEMARAQRHLIGAQALAMQSQESFAGHLASLWSVGLDSTDMERESKEFLKVTPDNVAAVGRKYFPADRQSIVMVGDRKVIVKQVEPFGMTVQVAP